MVHKITYYMLKSKYLPTGHILYKGLPFGIVYRVLKYFGFVTDEVIEDIVGIEINYDKLFHVIEDQLMYLRKMDRIPRTILVGYDKRYLLHDELREFHIFSSEDIARLFGVYQVIYVPYISGVIVLPI